MLPACPVSRENKAFLYVLSCVVFVAAFRRTDKRHMMIYTNDTLILERGKGHVLGGISTRNCEMTNV